MKTPFRKLDAGDNFIRIPEIESEVYTPVYRKFRNIFNIKCFMDNAVINAVKEKTGEFVPIPEDEEVILISR